MSRYTPPFLPLKYDFDSVAILKQLNKANRVLAELKGISHTIPNEKILISTLTLQEAKDSSEIENIITTQDDLYHAQAVSLKEESKLKASAKEVLNYRQALDYGYGFIKEKDLLSENAIKEIQGILVHNSAGFRRVPGTVLKSSNGEVVYTPPQSETEIIELMNNLILFINDSSLSDLDPLVKLAIIHHQFESIHPFYDGNGRTGRIICVLYLVLSSLLDLPILYLSRYITHNKAEYYQLIQKIRDNEKDNKKEWEDWILFMLKAVESTAQQTIVLVKGISKLMQVFKTKLREKFGKQYRHELINNLFFHPYTKVSFLEREMNISRSTAQRYLNIITDMGLLKKIHRGRNYYYLNESLMEIFLNLPNDSKTGKNEQ